MAFDKKVSENELDILYYEWSKTKNINPKNLDTMKTIDYLLPLNDCFEYFIKNFSKEVLLLKVNDKIR